MTGRLIAFHSFRSCVYHRLPVSNLCFLLLFSSPPIGIHLKETGLVNNYLHSRQTRRISQTISKPSTQLHDQLGGLRDRADDETGAQGFNGNDPDEMLCNTFFTLLAYGL